MSPSEYKAHLENALALARKLREMPFKEVLTLMYLEDDNVKDLCAPTTWQHYREGMHLKREVVRALLMCKQAINRVVEESTEKSLT